MEKTNCFIVGLPRSGSTMLTNILKQNPMIHGESVSSLASIFGTINNMWFNFDANLEYDNPKAKKGILKSILEGYYSHIDRPIIFDKDRQWICLIPQLEEVLQKQVKMIVCVRNPAEILSSFEKMRKENPLFVTRPDQYLKEKSTVASRALYFATPEGPMGMAYANIKDAVIMGYLDRLLFVDYNLFCGSPKSQLKRIYDFFEFPHFEHNLSNIEQNENYNDLIVGFPNLHKIKPSVDKTTINCVQYLGLDLYEQYNREIFWNAWI